MTRPARIAVSFCAPGGGAPRCASIPNVAIPTSAATTTTFTIMSSSLEVESEAELLPALRAFGQREAELCGLQAALIPQPVVHVEHVEHFPECRRRSFAAEPDDLRHAEIGAPLGGATA